MVCDIFSTGERFTNKLWTAFVPTFLLYSGFNQIKFLIFNFMFVPGFKQRFLISWNYFFKYRLISSIDKYSCLAIEGIC